MSLNVVAGQSPYRSIQSVGGDTALGPYRDHYGGGRLSQLLATDNRSIALVTPAGSPRLWRPEFQGLALVG